MPRKNSIQITKGTKSQSPENSAQLTKATKPQSLEVFTPASVVRHMSDLCEPLLSDPARKVFEPGCGTGAFLVEILSRRLQKIQNPKILQNSPKTPKSTNLHLALISLSNLYGIDIVPEYLAAARDHLRAVMQQYFPSPNDYRFFSLVDLFLENNLIQADLLKNREKITFIDWQPTSDFAFQATPIQLSELLLAAEAVNA